MSKNEERLAENLEVVELTKQNEELTQQNKCLQEVVWCLEEEKLKLQQDVESLQKKCFSLQQQLSDFHRQQCHSTELDQVIPEIKDVSSSVSAGVVVNDSCVKNVKETIANILEEIEEDHHSPVSVNCSVKSELKNGAPKSCSECALQQTKLEIPPVQRLNSFAEIQKYQINRNSHFLQNPVCIDELLLEMKTVIDDLEITVEKSDNISAVSQLKRIMKCLEDKFSSEINKTKDYSKFTNLVENVIFHIKSFTAKQENVITSLKEKVDVLILGNHNLYSKIRTLKDLLRSYGFLKMADLEKEIEPKSILFPLDTPSILPKYSYDDFSNDMAKEPLLKRIIVPLLPIINSSFKMLNKLNENIIELQFGMDSSQELTTNLIKRVQDQEMHLKGVTKEIEEVQQLVSVLKKQHRKLQSAEGILKYDLQEKRKLLTKLKEQLENTREDFNRVRIKNSQSEAEWQDLHNEFIQRHKQTSDESGFMDDKSFEDHENVSSNSDCDCASPSENTPKEITSILSDVPTKAQRLKLMEEQCQNLFSNLLRSSQRRQDIDKRLENMCKIIKSNELLRSNDFSVERNFENSTDTVKQESPENNGESINLTNDSFIKSPQALSDIESSTSESSSFVPDLYNEVHSSDVICCDSSKTDSCVSIPSEFQIDTSTIEPAPAEEQINETHLSDLDSISGCKRKRKDCDNLSSSCESAELTSNNIKKSQLLRSMSHVESILIKKKNLEESLKNLEICNETESSKGEILPQPEEFFMQTFTSEEDKMNLLGKIQELERKIFVLTTELDEMTQQQLLSKAAKEHQVATLESQLNAQAFEYEKSLKEFGEQSKVLESMKKRVTEQEQLILVLEDTLTEICADRKNEKECQWQESMSEVEQEQNKNEVLLSQLKQIKAHNQKDKENMEAEVIYLKKYSKELQKKLIKLLKEKDILWKRNNHLCHLQKIKIDDRWMNDSEVSSCLGCKNNFSLMLRKHHCRLCGRIFCYLCSNNWLLTASSSKKIRACNECFMQYIEIKKDIRRGSEVPCIEDDSGDEADNTYLPFIPMDSSVFNPGAPLSIPNSASSLPFIEKHSTPRFTSAPDLRNLIERDEVLSCSFSSAKENFKDENGKMATMHEDITKSLEMQSEGSDFGSLEKDVQEIYRLLEISVEEIKSQKCGLSGKFVINPQGRVDLPIFCHTYPVILKWSFVSNYQNISLIITHEDDKCSRNPKTLYQASNKMQDEVELSLPGCFILRFNNSSRHTEMEVKYLLEIKCLIEKNEH